MACAVNLPGFGVLVDVCVQYSYMRFEVSCVCLYVHPPMHLAVVFFSSLDDVVVSSACYSLT